MTKLYSLLVLFFAITLFSGCGSDGDDPELQAPTNLVVNATVSTDGSGEVTFAATADGETYYEFAFGDAAFFTPQNVRNGSVVHVYEESGDYTVTVKAFTNKDLFITTTKDITVAVFINIPATGYSTPEEYPNMVSYWTQEFDEPLNEDEWTFELGGGGWGNQELEYYRKQNTSVVDGHLVITAKAESVGANNYTSSRIITKDKKTFQYGRIDVRAALPKGKGIWPAIWMLGNNIGTQPWPKCGEIDIMEMIGGAANEKTVYGTAHYDNNGYESNGGHYDLPTGILADKFHVFTIIWTEEMITWYIDDIKYHELPITATRTEFQEEFFFVLNVAVGGNWPGPPDDTLKFPQRMIIDYIRVFKPE